MFNYSLSAEQINETYYAGLANHSVYNISNEETSETQNWIAGHDSGRKKNAKLGVRDPPIPNH